MNEVLAQAPKPGTELIVNSTVRINVSKGPRPITVPNVVGSAFETAQSTAPGHRVRGRARGRRGRGRRGDRGRPEPGGRHPAGQGLVVTLQVSKGPATSQVPDVTSQTEADARAQLKASGFDAQVVEEIVDDQTLDGRVLSQDPEGGTDAKQGTAVVIVVGRFQAPAETTDRTRAVSGRIRVAVVAGGRSSEHEISLASARSVLEALDPARYEVTQIAIGRDGRWALEAAK